MKKETLLTIIFFSLQIFNTSTSFGQIIITIAGTGVAGYSGDYGPPTAAKLNSPVALSFGSNGDYGTLFVADGTNNAVREIKLGNNITTIAGNGTIGFSGDGGSATAALMHEGTGVVKNKHNDIFLCDFYNNRIRKINTAGIITTIAGTGVAGYNGDGIAATLAEIYQPYDITVDKIGNIYFGDCWNMRVRKIDTFGIIHTIAGNGSTGYSGDGGPATNAMLNYPFYVHVDSFGRVVFTDNANHRVRLIDTTGIIHTIVGTGVGGFGGDGGPATAAQLLFPTGSCYDSHGNLYVSDCHNNRIRKVDVLTGIITSIAGTGVAGFSGDGGSPTAAMINLPHGITIDGHDNLFFVDRENNKIREIVLNHHPHFIHAPSDSLSICQNSISNDINSLFSAIDTDIAQTETWSLLHAPSHGTVVSSYATTSTGSVLIPLGLTYTPYIGYLGADMFKMLVSDGQFNDSITILVNVHAGGAGTITGSDSICVGSSTTFSESVTGGTWHIANTNATLSGTTVTGIATGFDTLFYVISGSTCGGDTAALPIVIATAPMVPEIFGNNYACIGGQPDTLTGSPANGIWSISNTNASVSAISIAQSKVIGLMVGHDTVTYSVSNICGSNATTKYISVYTSAGCDSVLSVYNINKTNDVFTIFPNPSNGIITLRLNSGLNTTYLCHVFNEIGQLTYRQMIEFNQNKLSLDFSKFIIGNYFIQLIGSNGIAEAHYISVVK